MPVEDNGFLLLETAGGQVAFLHASWTEWKNLFSFEIAGRTGKLEISGPRRQLRHRAPDLVQDVARRWGRPKPLSGSTRWPTIPGTREFRAFLEDIRLGRQPDPGSPTRRRCCALSRRFTAETPA